MWIAEPSTNQFQNQVWQKHATNNWSLRWSITVAMKWIFITTLTLHRELGSQLRNSDWSWSNNGNIFVDRATDSADAQKTCEDSFKISRQFRSMIWITVYRFTKENWLHTLEECHSSLLLLKHKDDLLLVLSVSRIGKSDQKISKWLR